MRPLYVLILGASLFFATTGGVASTDSLSLTASVFAQQAVVVECNIPTEDPILLEAWGYVYLWEPVIHMPVYLCGAAANINSPEYGMSRKALAVLVLIHESYHLRKSWSARGNEAKVECKAIRHFRVGAIMLGATPEYATQLRVYALQHHWRLAAKVPAYYRPDCRVPRA